MAQQLFKDKQNRLFLGVCSGISDSLGIDVTIIRLATILGTILTGSLIFWIYLLLAIILPNKK
jgi:phage shock protein C